MGLEIVATQPQVRFVGAIDRARGFIEAVAAVSPQDISMLDVHDRLKEVVDSGLSYVTAINHGIAAGAFDSQESRASVVMMLTITREGLSLLNRMREEHAGVDSAFWPLDFHERLVDLEEEVDDMIETIALRSSEEFKREVQAAIEESPSCAATRAKP